MTKDDKTFWKSNMGMLLQSNWKAALLITLLWKLLLLIVGYILDTHIGSNQGFPAYTGAWDGGWYNVILNDHYAANAASAAFYPLFPFATGLVQVISFHVASPLIAGQIVSTLSIWAATAALLSLGKLLLGNKGRFWLVALVLSAPAAFFAHMFYSEALFMAIGFWAYAFALKRQWLLMGISLAFLTATRLPALLVVGLCALEFMRAYDWKVQKIFNRNAFYFLLAPLGFLAYGTYLLFARGDFLAMFHAYAASTDWSYQVFNINIFKTLLRVTYEIIRSLAGLRPFDMDIIVNHLLPVTSLLILGLSSLWLLWKQRGKFIPLGITGLVSIVMFSLNSNVVSAHRYVLPCLSTYGALFLITKTKYQTLLLLCVCGLGVTVQLFLMALFISGQFAG